jgi:hypothetical protein
MSRWGWMWLFAIAATLGSGAHAGGDDLTVSRSRGPAGGSVILWPRIVPETQDPNLIQLAETLQARLSAMSLRVISDRKQTVRPRPERVCPMRGCRSVAVSVMLGHQDGGCVAVAMVSEPGTEGGTMLVPWAGDVDLRVRSVVFREPPENKLSVREFLPCDEILNHLDDPSVESALAAFSEG